MWNLLRALGNFYLYSSLHIALCAGLLSIESFYALDLPIQWPFVLFISLSTMAVYSAHRLVGMSKVRAFSDQGRYKVIKKFRRHILVYFIFSFMLSCFFFLKLELAQMLMMVLPVLLTAAYILPIFNSKRLRDFPLIKIFLIAIVWTWLTLGMVTDLSYSPFVLMLFLERICFFIAITIPFDIRDVIVDKSIDVQTLIHKLGIRNSKILALGLLSVCFCIISYLFRGGDITPPYFIALGLSYLFSAVLVAYSDAKKGDYFYGGLLDGTIGLRLLLLLYINSLLGS